MGANSTHQPILLQVAPNQNLRMTKARSIVSNKLQSIYPAHQTAEEWTLPLCRHKRLCLKIATITVVVSPNCHNGEANAKRKPASIHEP